MITVTADVALAEKLRQANGPAEIRDPEGKVVGFFAPVGVEQAGLDAQRTESDWEELHGRAQSTEGRTLREIFQHLQSLTPDEAVRTRLQKKIDVEFLS